jgi:hypothetical protein
LGSIFLTYLCQEYKIDLLKEAEKKIAVNEAKYPQASGDAKARDSGWERDDFLLDGC